MHLNIRSIRHKLDLITDYLTDMKILCFSETHLDINVPTESLLLSNTYYEPYRKDRNNFGGGLFMYINSNLVHTRKPDLEIFCPESIWAEIKTKNESYLIGLFYSPDASDAIFLTCFNRNIEKAFDITNNVILVGDLNEDLLNSNYHNLRDILLINSLQNVITDATRHDAILDPILIPDDMAYVDAGVINTPAHISNHKRTL